MKQLFRLTETTIEPEKTMYFKTLKETDCLKFSNLAACQGIAHGVFTRHGGTGHLQKKSLNVSLKTSDDLNRVMGNRTRINHCMNGTRLFSVHQVHGTEIVALKDSVAGDIRHEEPLRADAVISNIPGLDLMIMTADCQAVLLFDPIGRVCANIHSGWRGSLENIISKTIDVMNDRFSTDPTDLIAGIGPSLGPCCAEFVNFKSEIPPGFRHYRCPAPGTRSARFGETTDSSTEKKKHKNNLKNHFDFWAISRDQLTGAGVRPENIETGQICTKCNSHLFFSYRKSGTTGRFANVIGIRTI